MFAFHCFPVDPDSFVLTPAVVITQGREEDSNNLARSWMISFQWMLWGIGLSICLES